MDHITNNTSTAPLEVVPWLYQILLSILYAVTAIVAFVSNLLTIIVLFKGRRCTRDLRKFLVNLSVADMCMAVLTIPFSFSNYLLGKLK